MGISKRDEVEDLVDGLLFSDLQDTACLKWWEQHEATYLAKGPAGKALVALAKRWIWLLLSFPLIQSFITRYLTPPATSTAVERLFSAAGLIMDAKRNKLSPAFVDKLLFLREAHLLGICKLDWKWIVHMYFLNTLAQKYRLSTTVSFSLYKYHSNHIVSSVLCTSLLQKYRLCTSVICKHCISYKKVKHLCDDHPLDYWNKWDTHKGQSSSCINITRYIGEF